MTTPALKVLDRLHGPAKGTSPVSGPPAPDGTWYTNLLSASALSGAVEMHAIKQAIAQRQDYLKTIDTKLAAVQQKMGVLDELEDAIVPHVQGLATVNEFASRFGDLAVNPTFDDVMTTFRLDKYEGVFSHVRYTDAPVLEALGAVLPSGMDTVDILNLPTTINAEQTRLTQSIADLWAKKGQVLQQISELESDLKSLGDGVGATMDYLKGP